jgi:hypothetical protein
MLYMHEIYLCFGGWMLYICCEQNGGIASGPVIFFADLLSDFFRDLIFQALACRLYMVGLWWGWKFVLGFGFLISTLR